MGDACSERVCLYSRSTLEPVWVNASIHITLHAWVRRKQLRDVRTYQPLSSDRPVYPFGPWTTQLEVYRFQATEELEALSDRNSESILRPSVCRQPGQQQQQQQQMLLSQPLSSPFGVLPPITQINMARSPQTGIASLPVRHPSSLWTSHPPFSLL